MKTLEEIVADLAGCASGDLSSDFALGPGGLETSLKRALLIASIRRHLGKDCMQAGVVKTFGELRAAVDEAPAL
ncbi:MAG: hypothetical protein KKA81_17250 [Bacteroidetes bacterium]|nr:hypothetical protein [Bacteroidota bacterium]